MCLAFKILFYVHICMCSKRNGLRRDIVHTMDRVVNMGVQPSGKPSCAI